MSAFAGYVGAPGANRLAQSFPNVIAESIDRYAISANVGLLSTGRLSSVSIPVLAGQVITSEEWLSGVTPLSVPTHLWFALCDSSYNVIRQSTDLLGTAVWGANSLLSEVLDSVPVTAGARAGSTTVTLTFPTLSQSLSALFAPGDSIVVSNANIAAYNGTFSVVTVGASTITYVSGGSATDSLAAPFPTVQLAAGKRTYTVPANGIVYAVVMVAGTVPSLNGMTGISAVSTQAPSLGTSGDTGLTGTCPSPIAHATGASFTPWAALL